MTNKPKEVGRFTSCRIISEHYNGVYEQNKNCGHNIIPSRVCASESEDEIGFCFVESSWVNGVGIRRGYSIDGGTIRGKERQKTRAEYRVLRTNMGLN